MKRARVRSAMVAAALAAAAICQGCGEAVDRNRVNVILISIDTLRADHLGVYGYQRDTSPAIDRFARDAVLFSDAIVQAPRTVPSHAAIFTSLLPSHNGALANYRFKLSDDRLTMAEILSEHGFNTVSFNDGGVMAANYGFAQGFDLYDSTQSKGAFATRVAAAKKWLSENRDAPFFLFLHTYEVHVPLEPAPEYLAVFETAYSGPLPDVIRDSVVRRVNRGEIKLSDDDLEHLIALYDAAIRSMDDAFQDLIAFLEASSLYDQSLIVFTSDHGEEYGERGRVANHGATLHDEVLRVPLILKLPDGRSAGRLVVSTQVRSIDILPTILEIVGIPPLGSFEGTSLMRALPDGRLEPLPAVSQIDGDKQVSLRDGAWKLIRTPRGTSLFDLRNDPSESRDEARARPDIVRRMSFALDRIIDGRPARTTPYEPTEEEIEQLRGLGYLE